MHSININKIEDKESLRLTIAEILEQLAVVAELGVVNPEGEIESICQLAGAAVLPCLVSGLFELRRVGPDAWETDEKEEAPPCQIPDHEQQAEKRRLAQLWREEEEGRRAHGESVK